MCVDNNLFVINCRVVSECNHVSSDAEFNLWHRRMGHVNAQDLSVVLCKSCVGSKSVQSIRSKVL